MYFTKNGTFASWKLAGGTQANEKKKNVTFRN